MKNIILKKLRIVAIILVGSLFCMSSCTEYENELLTEVPKDFLTPENSFTTSEGFIAALADIYRDNRSFFYFEVGGDDDRDRGAIFGVDADIADVYFNTADRSSIKRWDLMNADKGSVRTFWQRFYSIIFKANVIIGRADADVVTWASEAEKNAIVAEAKFLRAYAYTFLANMWGGVPIILTETTVAKFDYTRASQTDVYNQCVEDLLFAVAHLPVIDEQKGGRAPRAAAYHQLSQVYIQMGEYQKAIDAASEVIDNSGLQLMTERFGRYKDFTFSGYDYLGPKEPWGDVYWDLFREGNFNRIDGNTEVIWNIQMDYNITGGGATGAQRGTFMWEYAFGGPATFAMRDKNNVPNFRKDTLGGTPVGWYLQTDYQKDKIWRFKDDFDKDMRNSKYNQQRTWYFTNPESEFYGQEITPDNMWEPDNFDIWAAPSNKKPVTAVHYGGRVIVNDNDDFGRIFKDWYIMRLAETYLLRAEAYHLAGQDGNAAIDINAVRNRAQATPVDAGDVSLDLILDERARELYAEEFRLNTLMRMGKLAEYLMLYNGEIRDNGYQIDDFRNKFPIPNSEIERNTGAVLEQNPGY